MKVPCKLLNNIKLVVTIIAGASLTVRKQGFKKEKWEKGKRNLNKKKLRKKQSGNIIIGGSFTF